jgi:hypothetical protein
MAKKRFPNLRCQLLDVGTPRLGVGTDCTHADSGIVDYRFYGPKLSARDLDGTAATRFRPKLRDDWIEALGLTTAGLQAFERASVAVHGCDAVAVMEKRSRHHSSNAAGCAGQ